MYYNYNDVFKVSVKIFKAEQFEQPVVEAESLLCFSFKVKKEEFPLKLIDKIDYKPTKSFFSKLERRYLKEPAAYISEQKEFYSNNFYVNRSVLIPRGDTEPIVDYFLEKTKSITFKVKLIDVGVGSGNIILSIILTNRNLHGLAVDVSLNALKVASKNSKLLKLRFNKLIEHNVFDSLNKIISSDGLDFIISNPPYINSSDMLHLMDDVKNYEPHLALNSGEDELIYYRLLLKEGKNLLSLKGEIIVEIGYDMAEKVISLFEADGYILKKVIKDLSGIERTLIFGLSN